MLSVENGQLDRLAIAQDRKRLPFTLYADLDLTATKSWLVKGLLGEAEASAFYGPPGCGKSVLLEDMALHVAGGEPWFGRAVLQGGVLYIALERAALVKRRAIAYRKRHGVERLPFAIMQGVYDFRLSQTAADIAGIVRKFEAETGERVVLIIIDTISRALAGGDENSSKDMGAMVATTARLQEQTKAHVCWVHHVPIDGDRLRGHGALLGALDTTLSCEKRASGLRVAKVVKANDSEEDETISFTLESVDIGPETTAPVVVSSDDTGGQQASSRKLSTSNVLALRSLSEVVLSHGIPAPVEYQLPAGTRVVLVDQWREELYRSGTLEKGESSTSRMQFKRMREGLSARGLIGMRDEFVWSAAQ